jgi:hypothetical protein
MTREGLTRRSLLAGVTAGYFASNVRVRARSSDPASLTIDDARALIASRKLSPAEITRANPRLNAYITVTADSALKQAEALEAEIAKGSIRGPGARHRGRSARPRGNWLRRMS